eukprot:GEMP01104929.1.p1 GENE.GEMP01104929.1~~GEMP01104929.1.p1  ORF type:complete len:131 (+),score=20.09 GEMP01104929.1:185-577(+)
MLHLLTNDVVISNSAAFQNPTDALHLGAVSTEMRKWDDYYVWEERLKRLLSSQRDDGPLSHLARKDLKTACVTLQRELPSIHYLALISHGPQTQSKTIAGFHVILTSQRQVLIQLYINRFPSHKHVHSKV